MLLEKYIQSFKIFKTFLKYILLIFWRMSIIKNAKKSKLLFYKIIEFYIIFSGHTFQIFALTND